MARASEWSDRRRGDLRGQGAIGPDRIPAALERPAGGRETPGIDMPPAQSLPRDARPTILASPSPMGASAAGSAPIGAWSGPGATGSAACARTATGPVVPGVRRPWRRSVWTRSRRSRCSTWIRARSRTRSPPSAAPSTACSARTGRSPRPRALGWTSRSGPVARADRRGRACASAPDPSPTPTSSRPSSSSTRSTPAGSRGGRACATCSSPTATPPPRPSTSSRRSSTPPTWISRASTTRSTGACAAPGWPPCSMRSSPTATPASGWS